MQRSLHHISRDGTRIWYGTVGEGPAIVLCDGLACDGFIWPYLIDHFCDDFTLIRWHYRGHGVSDNPRNLENLTLAHLCEDLHGVLGELGIDSAVFIGHSMGVQVILQYYDYFPEQVQALIPMCGSYKRPLDTFHNTDTLLRALPYLQRLVDLAPDTVQTLWKTIVPARLFYSMAAVGSEINGRLLRRKDFLPYLDHVAQMNLKVFFRLLENLADHTAEDILPDVAVPTLIIAGEHDTFTPMFRSVEMSERIDDSELFIVPCGTHVAPLELPDSVNAAVEKFLMRHGFMQAERARALLP